jgi:hypothetical protein
MSSAQINGFSSMTQSPIEFSHAKTGRPDA